MSLRIFFFNVVLNLARKISDVDCNCDFAFAYRLMRLLWSTW